MKRVIDARPPSGRLLQALCSAPLILAVAGDNFISARFVACLVCLTQLGCRASVCMCVFLYWALVLFFPSWVIVAGWLWGERPPSGLR